jgi:hypothetical protein
MTIFIFALHGVVTGGPEATHQLSDALIEQGFDAQMIYFRWDDLKGGPLREFPAYEPFAPEYARYKAKLTRQAFDDVGHVVVLPETLAHAAPFFQRAKVLIWWLSVDNAFSALSAINLNYLRRPNVFHASQSRYAEGFVEALGFNSLGMLSDYTVDLTEYATPLPMAERPKIVAFNARPDKVIADLEAIGAEIASLDPEIKCIAIHGMSRPEIAAVFAAARVYVDLGNFPGKDRMPREAARMGCAVLTETAGAGLEFGASARYVSRSDIGETAREVVRQVNGFSRFEPPYRECDTFNTEVCDVFSKLEVTQ